MSCMKTMMTRAVAGIATAALTICIPFTANAKYGHENEVSNMLCA